MCNGKSLLRFEDTRSLSISFLTDWMLKSAPLFALKVWTRNKHCSTEGWGEFLLPLVSQTVKNLPAVQKIRVQSLRWEDLLEKGMATHSSILAWRIPWTEKPGRLQSMGSQRVGHKWTIFSLSQREENVIPSAFIWYTESHPCPSLL